MRNKETIIGIALLLLGDGIGAGLQMLGIINQHVAWVVIALSSLAGIGLFIYGIKFKDNKLASQMDDEEKGEHLIDIKGKLIIWRKQLRTLAKKKKTNIAEYLLTDIEKDPEFYQVLQHCPSLAEPAKKLSYARMLAKAKLKSIRNGNYQESKKELKEQREDANLKMKAVAKVIDICLKEKEYSVKENLCDWCRKHQEPKKDEANSRLRQNVIAEAFIIVSFRSYQFIVTEHGGLQLLFLPRIDAMPAVRVEDIILELKGERHETNWQPMDEPRAGEIGAYIQADIPMLKPGSYQARIIACIDNTEHPSKPITMEYRQSILGKPVYLH